MGKGELYKIISCNYIVLLCFIFLNADMADAQPELKKPTVVENPTVVKTPKKKVSSKKTQSVQTNQKKSRSKTKKPISKRRVSQPYLRISAESVNVGSSGGTRYLDIQTNREWKIALSTASWGHLEKSGNRIILKVDENKAIIQPQQAVAIIKSSTVYLKSLTKARHVKRAISLLLTAAVLPLAVITVTDTAVIISSTRRKMIICGVCR